MDPLDWNPEIANELAVGEAILLDEEYWVVLEFMRNFYLEHLIAPDVRHVVAHLVEVENFDKKQAKRHLFELFPYGYVKQACKIAGMRKPRAWSTG